MNKNKILIGLGTISAAAMPALAVVACGSEENATTASIITGEKWIKLVDADNAEDFLDSVKDTNEATFTVKSDLTVEKYNEKVEALNVSDEIKNAIKKVMTDNDNDPKLAAYVINFTITTIKFEGAAASGLIDGDEATEIQDHFSAIGNGDEPKPWTIAGKALYDKMHNQISGGELKASVIALGIMKKFNGEDPIWGSSVTTAFSVNPGTKPVASGATLTATGILASIAKMTMGGDKTIGAILESQGYVYVPTPTTAG